MSDRDCLKSNALLVVLFLLISTFAVQGIASGMTPETFMSRDRDGLVRTDTFFCHDTVYVQSILTGLKKSSHRASVSWINPKGKEQSFSEQDFSASGVTRVWFWLKLHPSFGGKFLKSVDPSIGMSDYVGMWILKLRIDGELIDVKTFFVAC